MQPVRHSQGRSAVNGSAAEGDGKAVVERDGKYVLMRGQRVLYAVYSRSFSVKNCPNVCEFMAPSVFVLCILFTVGLLSGRSVGKCSYAFNL